MRQSQHNRRVMDGQPVRSNRLTRISSTNVTSPLSLLDQALLVCVDRKRARPVHPFTLAKLPRLHLIHILEFKRGLT